MKFAVVIAILVAGAAVNAQIPLELKQLVPAGQNEVTLQGSTMDQKGCSVEFFSAKNRFSASLQVYDGFNRIDYFRYGKFQLGGAYKLAGDVALGETHNYVSLIPQQDLQHEVRSTLKLHRKDAKLKAVQVLIEEKSFVGFDTLIKESCYLK